jgi:hypothetical protein
VRLTDANTPRRYVGFSVAPVERLDEATAFHVAVDFALSTLRGIATDIPERLLHLRNADHGTELSEHERELDDVT